MPRWTWTTTLILAALATPCNAFGDEYESARTKFRVAYAAAQAGGDYPASDDESLRDYPLYPYLEVVRLGRDLGADAAIAAYLDQHGAAPYTRSLRGAWLADLGRRKQWEMYLRYYDEKIDRNPTLRCHALAARAALGRDEGLEEAIAAQQRFTEPGFHGSMTPAKARILPDAGLLRRT